MYTVMGITARVGSVLGHDLLKAGLPLRVVVPDAVNSSRWAALARALVRDVRFRDDGKHALRGGVTLVEAIAALVRES